MDALEAFAIAAIQGATELFPVSSLGHAVIVPALLGWKIDQHGEAFLPFLVLLHVGTAVALLGYFSRDWLAILSGAVASDAHRRRESRHILVLIIVATLPAILLGGALEHRLRALFGAPAIAAGFLVANGVLLIVGERLRRRAPGQGPAIATLTLADALVIGLWQCLALLPGISRSGATILGGLRRGLDHEGAARFSFLIAAPIILAATVFEVPKLLHASIAPGTLTLAAEAAVVAGLVALASTAFLMRYFRANDRWSLDPFGIYCLLAGGGALAFFYA